MELIQQQPLHTSFGWMLFMIYEQESKHWYSEHKRSQEFCLEGV